jgi:hypothetical protein
MRFPNPLRFLRALFHFARRPELAPDRVQAAREDRCRTCPFYEQTDLGAQCQSCTCLVSLKVMLATEKCPEKRWGEYFTPVNPGI